MIRPVRPSDTKEITAIYNRYIERSTATFEIDLLTEEDMGRRITAFSASHPYLVYECDGRVAGYCYAHRWQERAAYSRTLETTVYVHPSYCRRGIGRELMLRLIDECRKEGYIALVACITAENEGSRRLHRDLGFKQVSQFEKVGMKFGRLLDVTDYELLLTEEQTPDTSSPRVFSK